MKIVNKNKQEIEGRNLVIDTLSLLVAGTVFWYLWGFLAPIYFTNILPDTFIYIPYWHTIGFIFIFNTIKTFIFK